MKIFFLILIILVNFMIQMIYFNSFYPMFISSSLIKEMTFFNFNLTFETLTSTFIIMVLIISMCIFLYSSFYLDKTEHSFNYFNWVVMFFLMSMLILISSNSMILYIFGWDGLGVTSFILVMFYSNMLSTRSALATFLTNRLGDFFIIASFIVIMHNNFLDFEKYNYSMWNDNNMKLGVMLMILGCATKSAQLPFSAWLPAAMAAPTPVSALVHSSTLVTAGIFLLSRFITGIDLNNMTTHLLSLMSISLSCLAGLMAWFESDFKKLIAMSTLSQMGILAYILFVKNYTSCIFHLMSHATFKSLLFLVVGYFIMINMGLQDSRLKCAANQSMVTPKLLFLMTNCSLMGTMFSSGFFSKDMILLEQCSTGLSLMTFFVLFFSCIMTVLYTLKAFILIFNNFYMFSVFKNNTVKLNFLMPAINLFVFTLFFGVLFFFLLMDYESYTPNMMNKMMGFMVLMAGAMIMILANSAENNYFRNFMFKNMKEFFSQMSNLNWLSNNLVSSKLMEINILSKKEMLWWDYFSSMWFRNNLLSSVFYKNNYYHIKSKTLKMYFFCLMLIFLSMFYYMF